MNTNKDHLTSRSGELDTPALPEDPLFFDGGWCWMSHPEFNEGNAIPVKMDVVDGVRWFYPCDPAYVLECEWDRKDDEWEIIAPWHADSDNAFLADIMRVKTAALVDELRAEIAGLKANDASHDLLAALQAFMALDRTFSTICDAHLEEAAADSAMARAVKLARAAIAKAESA